MSLEAVEAGSKLADKTNAKTSQQGRSQVIGASGNPLAPFHVKRLSTPVHPAKPSLLRSHAKVIVESIGTGPVDKR